MVVLKVQEQLTLHLFWLFVKYNTLSLFKAKNCFSLDNNQDMAVDYANSPFWSNRANCGSSLEGSLIVLRASFSYQSTTIFT